jgi:division protein CdvB (Snf7/Vps24/ESCRT-III family)
MAKKEYIKMEVEAFAQVALALRDALETMESQLDEAGYSLDDFVEEEEEEEDAEEEADEEIEEEEDSSSRKKPRFPKLK